MGYNAYLTYEHGQCSHKMFSRDRKKIQLHLEELLADVDLRKTAKQLVLEYRKKPLFVCDMSKVNSDTMSKIRWPRSGNKTRIKDPKIACLSMPSQMHDFLKKRGGGNVSKALQEICLTLMREDNAEVGCSVDDMYYKTDTKIPK